jgi:hypothetical protein
MFVERKGGPRITADLESYNVVRPTNKMFSFGLTFPHRPAINY